MGLVIREETSLKNTLDELSTETSWLDRLWQYELGGGLAVALLGLLEPALRGSWWATGTGCVLAFLGAAHWFKGRENRGEIGRVRGGVAGEEQVTAILRKWLPDDYLIINDVTVRAGERSAQNDHIVLGPNGIFVIETKANTGLIAGAAADEFLEQTREQRGKRMVTKFRNPIPQNDLHLAVVKERMAEGKFMTDDVHSLIVFTSPRAKVEITNSHVSVLKTDKLVAKIKANRVRHAYPADWLRRVALHLAPDVKLPPAAEPAR